MLLLPTTTTTNNNNNKTSFSHHYHDNDMTHIAMQFSLSFQLVPLSVVIVVGWFWFVTSVGKRHDWFGLNPYQLHHLDKGTHPFQTRTETNFWFLSLTVLCTTLSLVYLPTIVYLQYQDEQQEEQEEELVTPHAFIHYLIHLLSVLGTFPPMAWIAFVHTGFLGLMPPPYALEQHDRQIMEQKEQQDHDDEERQPRDPCRSVAAHDKEEEVPNRQYALAKKFLGYGVWCAALALVVCSTILYLDN